MSLVTTVGWHGGRRWSLPPALALAALALAVVGTAWADIELTRHMTEISVLWPANAVVLMVLLRAESRFWPAFLVAGHAADLAVRLAGGGTVPIAMGLAACDTVEVLLCAAVLRHRLGTTVELTRNADIAALGIAAVLASAVSAALAGMVLAVLSSSSFTEVWRGWALAHALGLLIFAPPLLAARPEELRPLLQQRGATARAGALLLLTAGVTAAIFAQDSYLAVCAIFPLLVVIAFSQGSGAAAVASLLVAAISIGFSLAGLGPIAAAPQPSRPSSSFSSRVSCWPQRW